MKKSIQNIILGTTSILAVGCVSKLPPMPTLPSVNIPSIDGYNKSNVDLSNSKILVAPGVNSSIAEYMQTAFANEVTTIIGDIGTEVIDRELASRFIDEIQLKENLSENYQPYEGPVEAKLVVISTITGVSYGGSYKKSYTSTNKKGERTYHDARCSYRANVKANVQIRELPSMKQILSMNVEDSSSTSKDNPPSRSCNESSMYNSAISGAISDLLTKGDDNYKTLSKYIGSQGVITDAKSFDGNLYFETNLGRIHGAKEKEKVAIYQNIDDELVLIAEGEMADEKNVLRKKSYIKVGRDEAQLLKKGMIIQLSGKCASLRCKVENTSFPW